MSDPVSPKYKAVIFDFDDTLVKSHILKWAHHKETGKRFYNLDITNESLKKHWGKPLHLLIEELYGGVDTNENILKSILSIGDEFLKEVHEDAPKIIEEFFNNNIKIGVVSAAPKEFIVKDLERLGFNVNHFTFIQGSNDTDFHKPDPRVFDPVFERLLKLDIEKKDIIYIGDSVDDVEAAHSAGINFIGISTGIYKSDELVKKGSKIVLSHIKELPEYILS